MVDDPLAALEARVIDDPDDLDAWSVLADELQKRGDPQGELIALHIAAHLHPPDDARTTSFLDAFASYAPALIESLVPYGASTTDPYTGPFAWRRGSVHRAAIADSRANAALGALLALPAARFLGELSLRVSGREQLQQCLDVLAAHPPRALRELDLMADAHVPDLGVLWSRLPRLRRITVTANRLEVSALELPEARRARFLILGFSARSMQALVRARWPRLEQLELFIGFDARAALDNLERELAGLPPLPDTEVFAAFADFAPLLARTDLPALTLLRVRNAPFAGDILRVLCDSPLAGQLEVLDLSGGDLSVADVQHAATHRSAFTRLRELWVPDKLVEAAAGIARHIVRRDQADPFDGQLMTLSLSGRR